MLALIGGANPRRAHPPLSCSAAMLSVPRVGLHYLLPPQHKQILAGEQQRGGGGGEEGALTGKRRRSVGGREEGKRLQNGATRGEKERGGSEGRLGCRCCHSGSGWSVSMTTSPVGHSSPAWERLHAAPRKRRRTPRGRAAALTSGTNPTPGSHFLFAGGVQTSPRRRADEAQTPTIGWIGLFYRFFIYIFFLYSDSSAARSVITN